MDMSVHHDEFRLDNGAAGMALSIPTASPKNYHQAISDPDAMSTLNIQGKLFLPATGRGPFPVVIMVPGSLGLGAHHVAKAVPLMEAGIATCAIDPFGARSVTSTVANQALYSYAASAFDVLATVQHLASLPEVDEKRIGAQGHSRGGAAVLTAATTGFGRAVPGAALHAVYAAYPWSGHQFADPDVGATRIRAIIGDRDEWCLPQQVQSHIHAIRARGGNADIRVVGGAHHSFDRPVPLENHPDAAIAPGAPTVFIDQDGAFFHPLAERSNPELVDRDLFIYAAKAGYAQFGAHIGGGDGGLADLFHADMMTFWQNVMG